MQYLLCQNLKDKNTSVLDLGNPLPGKSDAAVYGSAFEVPDMKYFLL